jgi:hypothetical protein
MHTMGGPQGAFLGATEAAAPRQDRYPSIWCKSCAQVAILDRDNAAYPRPEDDFLGATDPCAGRSEILGQAGLMNAGNSCSVQRQRHPLQGMC